MSTAVCFLGALAGTIATTQCEGATGDQAANEYVQVHVRLSQSTFKQGETGTIMVKLTPAEDIHINAEPAVKIKLTSTGMILLSGSPGKEVDTSTGFVLTDSSVTQRFTVALRARPGTYRVTGTMTYFYCSKSEGWCRKQVEPIGFALTITR